MIDLKGTSIDAEEREWLQSPSVCGVILFSRNFESLGQLEQLIAVIHEIREPPLLVAVAMAQRPPLAVRQQLPPLPLVLAAVALPAVCE